jgi:hypothetical protein
MLLGGGEDDRIRTDAASWATPIAPGSGCRFCPTFLPKLVSGGAAPSGPTLPSKIEQGSQTITIQTACREFSEYLAQPTKTPAPAIVVRHATTAGGTSSRLRALRNSLEARPAGRGDEFQGGACERAERRRRTGAFLAMHLGWTARHDEIIRPGHTSMPCAAGSALRHRRETAPISAFTSAA